MHRYDYHRPGTLAETFALVKQQRYARFIAGGTDLIVKMRRGTLHPPALISLRGIRELSGIVEGEPLVIGATTPVSEVIEHPNICRRFPVLAQALSHLGSVQVRNAATIGGNLCNASPCADAAGPLLAHEARLRIVGAEGEREAPIAEFFAAPGETRLKRSEILAAVLLDAPETDSGAVFFKKGRVRMDLALVSVTVLLALDGMRCRKARMAAGSVAPTPMRLCEAESVLENSELSPELIERAAGVAMNEVKPITDLRSTAEYRRHLVGVFVRRAIAQIQNGSRA